MSKKIRFTYTELEKACRAALGCVDIDAIVNADQTAPTAEEAIIDGLLEVEDSPAAHLQAALRRLDPEERAVVEAAYGLDGYAPITMADATKLWGRGAPPLLRAGLDNLRADLVRYL